MSDIHYFQRYDNKENWITNATLLLFSRLYHFSPLKFEKVLNSILEDNKILLRIGVSFSQQEWGQKSVVDGMISQESFNLIIETKLHDNFTVQQLKNHLDAFPEGCSQKILLTLSKNNVSSQIRKEINEFLKNEEYLEIKLASTTYEKIHQLISNNLSDYDLEMRDILEDYYKILTEHDLINLENRTLLAFTCSDSLEENLHYSIYYDPAKRNHAGKFKYIGLYKNKSIVAIGKVNNIICCDYSDGLLISTNDKSIEDLSPDEYNRIKDVIEKTNYFDLRSGNKFFLVDKFYETDFKTPPFQSKKYLRLDEFEGFKEEMNAEEIANLLRGKVWK